MALSGAALLAAGGAAWAQSAYDEPESPLHGVARAIGLASPEPKVEDFVKESRPNAPTGWMPVFTTPPEPDSQVRSPDSLNAMDADLNATAADHQKRLADSATPAPAAAQPAKPKPKKTPVAQKPSN